MLAKGKGYLGECVHHTGSLLFQSAAKNPHLHNQEIGYQHEDMLQCCLQGEARVRNNM